ncbi:MAG TPA: hypothetical protein VLN48_06315 [Bryobacteraceae bacterium]|nr:hypothetical protein [Bryobacteraceae bacterium]
MQRLAIFLGLACAALWGQQVTLEPPHDSGQSVTAAFEGWFANPDGTFSILFGYFNRNFKEELDIPIGPENRIEPGGPDQGQPTHFLPRRQWGVFTVIVPKDFGAKKLTWTLVANGKTTQVPAGLDALWEVAPFKDATNNTPPYLGFAQSGPFANGPRGPSTALTAAVQTPMPLTIWVADDANVIPGATRPRTPAVVLSWSKYRGSGSVTFSNDKPAIETADVPAPGVVAFSGKASTTATFSEPGEYILRVVANDWSGEGGRGFQCCWSNAQVRVSVK